MAIGVVEFDLSMLDPDTGARKTANVYTVEGVMNADGSLRELSIGQLVMAICFKRASSLEASIIDLMNKMENASRQLELMTQIEEEVLDGSVAMKTKTLDYNGQSYTYYDFLTNVMELTDVPNTANAQSSDFITSLESKMDEKNSFSQQKMIELQSQTNKRDQSYDMISNILKSLNTVLVGNANNFTR